MYGNKTYLGIIPARGGSKGIPHKNTVMLNGKPLIAYTIEASLSSAYIDRVIVSTDDERIAEISKDYGAEVIKRPKDISGDEAATIDALLHVFSVVEEAYDFAVLLQPTSPLRTSIHINEAIEQHSLKGFESVVSVSLVKKSPALVRARSDDGVLIPIISEKSNVRRQEMCDYYEVNGAIYINRISQLDRFSSLNDNRIGYVMERKFSVDVDDQMDLWMAEALINGEMNDKMRK